MTQPITTSSVSMFGYNPLMMGQQYVSNPIYNMGGALLGLMNNNFFSNSASIGAFSNMGVMNNDLMLPQWMQNIQNQPYGFQQFDFTGLYNYQVPQFAQGAGAGTAQGAGAGAGTATQNPATQTVTNPQAQGQAQGAQPAGAQAQQQVANPYAQVAQQAQVNETTTALNMYGISSTGDAKKDEQLLKQAQEKENKVKEQASEIAEKLYDAMKGAGTKNEQLKQALEQLNNDNILYVLEEWNTNYSSDMGGETLIQSIQDEYHSGFFTNEQKNIEKILCDALFNKAKSMGLGSEAHAFRAKINAEHGNSWWLGGSSDASVQTSVDTIVAQISQKDVANRQGAYARAVAKNK